MALNHFNQSNSGLILIIVEPRYSKIRTLTDVFFQFNYFRLVLLLINYIIMFVAI